MKEKLRIFFLEIIIALLNRALYFSSSAKRAAIFENTP